MRKKIIILLVFVFFVGLGLAGCGKKQTTINTNTNTIQTIDNSKQQKTIQGYPIDPNDVKTTAERTIDLGTKFSNTIAKQDLDKIPLYDQYGYGVYSYGPALAYEKRTDIMPSDYSDAAVTKKAKLLNFFTISDIHITDKEAPNQMIYMQQAAAAIPVVTSLYSPIMPYTTHVLDAAIQTVNALNKKNPINFGISLGDAANSSGYNELRWYIDVIDGKVITPSSGAHLGAQTIDYQKPYKAAGLDKSIPFYQTFGNHDHFFLGSIPVEATGIQNTYTTSTVLLGGNILIPPVNVNNIKNPDYYMGVLDGSTPNADIKYAGPAANFTSAPQVAADPDRRSLLKSEWMEEFFNTTSNPVGHGFSQSNVENDFACYSFVPKLDVPIKVIVLDDTQLENDGSTDIHGHGFLTQDRWDWLKNELNAGDAAGQLMIIAAHIPIGVSPDGSGTEWWTNPNPGPNSPQNAVTLPELIAELQSHPNLLMWIAGHRHLNTVKAFPSTDPNHPENGFWQVETSSLRDFPQMLRTFEIYVNSDNNISIMATDVNAAVKEGTPAAKSRKYSAATEQIYQSNLSPNNPNSDPNLPPNTPDPSIHPMNPLNYAYNAELIKKLTPAMKEKMEKLFPQSSN